MTRTLSRALAIAGSLLMAGAAWGQGVPGGQSPMMPVSGFTASTPFTATGANTASPTASRFGHLLNAIDDFGAAGNATSIQLLVTSTTGGSSKTINFSTSGNWPAPSFSSVNIGMPIEIAGIGAASGALSTTITAVNSASQIVVSAGAQTAVSATAEAVMVGYDDTTAVQNAFNASAAQPVHIPCGTYRITAPLTTPVAAIIYGSNFHPYYYFPGTATTGPSPCQLLIGDGFTLSGGATAFLQVGAYSHIEDVGISLQNGPAIPVIYGTGQFVELWHDYVYGGTIGIQFAFSASPLNLGWSIKDNDVSETTGDCLYVQSTTDFHIQDNWLHACGGYSINMNAAGVGNIIGNTLEDNGVGGLRLAGATAKLAVVGNKFDGNYYCDLCFSGFTGNVSITGNFLDPTGAPGYGVWLFQNANSGTITSAGNTYYTTSATAASTFANTGTLTIPGSSFYETTPAVGTVGIFDSTATQKIIQPMISIPNQLGTSFSAAGTSLPSCTSSNKGTVLAVSDATLPTYGSAYVSGGAVYARVLCNGTAWVTE